MNATKKITKIFVILIIILNIIQGTCLAVSFPSPDEIFNSGKDFIEQGSSGGSTFSDSDIEGFVVPLANILVAIGTIIVVAALIIIGIKYMMATPEEAAKLKQQLIGVIVAAVVIFGAVTIWRIMYDIMDSVESSL